MGLITASIHWSKRYENFIKLFKSDTNTRLCKCKKSLPCLFLLGISDTPQFPNNHLKAQIINSTQIISSMWSSWICAYDFFWLHLKIKVSSNRINLRQKWAVFHSCNASWNMSFKGTENYLILFIHPGLFYICVRKKLYSSKKTLKNCTLKTMDSIFFDQTEYKLWKKGNYIIVYLVLLYGF